MSEYDLFNSREFCLPESHRVPTGYYRAEGMIKNVNTIEEYRSIDKNALLLQAGKTVSKATKF